MLQLDLHPRGRHFLQIPGPSPVPDRVLRAMSLPTIDHRGPEFGALGRKVLDGLQRVFQTKHPVVVYPSSGTGAWEAALANVLLFGGFPLAAGLAGRLHWRQAFRLAPPGPGVASMHRSGRRPARPSSPPASTTSTARTPRHRRVAPVRAARRMPPCPLPTLPRRLCQRIHAFRHSRLAPQASLGSCGSKSHELNITDIIGRCGVVFPAGNS